MRANTTQSTRSSCPLSDDRTSYALLDSTLELRLEAQPQVTSAVVVHCEQRVIAVRHPRRNRVEHIVQADRCRAVTQLESLPVERVTVREIPTDEGLDIRLQR